MDCLHLRILLGLFAVITNGAAVRKVEVNEGDDAVLPCSPSQKINLGPTVIHWKTPNESGVEVYFYENGRDSGKGLDGQDKNFVGRVSHFQDELKNGNASIKIRNTRVDDGGLYIGILPHLQPKQMCSIQLFVNRIFRDRTGENPRASPKPRFKVINQTEDWALLQCEVQHASPKPSLELQDSFGNIIHAQEIFQPSTGGSLDTTVQATVNKSGTYRCILRQDELQHEIFDDFDVFMPKKVSCIEAIIGGVFVGYLLGVGTVIMSLLLALWISPHLRYRVGSVLLKLPPKCDKTAKENDDTKESMMDHRSSQEDFCCVVDPEKCKLLHKFDSSLN